MKFFLRRCRRRRLTLPSVSEKAAADYRCIEYKLQLACLRRRNLKVVLYTPVVTAIIVFPTDLEGVLEKRWHPAGVRYRNTMLSGGLHFAATTGYFLNSPSG